MSILLLTILATIFYTGFQVFSSRAGGKLDPRLVVIGINFVAVLITATWLIVLKFVKHIELLPTKPSGLAFASLAGASIALFAVTFATIFQKGAHISVISPLVFGGSILLASLIGIFVFHDKVTPLQILGLAVILSGIGILVFARSQAKV